MNKSNGSDFRRAAQAFRKATEADPAFAEAWAALAHAMFWVSDDEETTALIDADRREGLTAANKALALQPNLAHGYVVRGLIRASSDYDFSGAGEDFGRALKLEPENADALAEYSGSVLVPTGRLSEAVTGMRKAASLDPLNARLWSWLGFALMITGDIPASRQALYKSLEISPEQKYSPPILAQTFLLAGQPAAALEASQRSSDETFRLYGTALAQYDLGKQTESQQALDRVIETSSFGAAYQIAEIYARRGDKDQAFAWLERAHAQHDAGFAYVKVDPLLRQLHGDARFVQMLKLANLQ